MKMNADQFATVVRNLPLTTGQAAVAEELLAGPATKELPRELVRREVLTEYQARLILAGRAADLTVGRYALLEPLGEGGMGQVFKARDTGMDRVVALKLIRDDRLGNAAAVRRFEQEVKAAARLAHPNIVRAYDAGTADGKHFLVTELVVGHDLGRELQRRGAFPAAEACEYARQTSVGLQHAFEQGLTHRDIKPSNLLFSTAEKLVKVADFGLARVSASSAAGLTADGMVMGTPDYIAPEQASSATQADIRSDLYSLGCTLYQFLTGHVPFPTDNVLAKLMAHSSHEPEPLEDACPGLSPALIAVVRRLIAKRPGERFQTPREAAEALIPFCPRPKSSTSLVSHPGGSLSGSQPRPVPPPLPSTLGLGGSTARSAAETGPQVLPVPVPAPSQSRPVVLPEPLPVDDDDFDPEPLPRRGGRRPRDREPSGRSLWPLYAFLGLLAVGLVVAGVVVLVRGSGDGSQNSIQSAQQTNVNVTVPVNVTVKIDDWPAAKQPGVTVFLGDKALTAGDLSKPMSLTPGRYTLVAKKDGKELEARAFDVTSESEGQAVATRPVAVPEPDADPGEVMRWGTSIPTTAIRFMPDGKLFAAISTTIERWGGPWASAEVFEPLVGGRRFGTGLPTSVDALWFCPDGTTLCVGPIHAGSESYTSHIYYINSVNQTGASFFRSNDGYTIFRATSERNRRPNALTNHVHLFTTSRDCTRLAWAASPSADKLPDQIEVVEVTSDKGRWTLTNPQRFPGSTACFVPGRADLLTASDRTLRFHDIPRGRPLEPQYTGPAGDVVCVASSSSFFAAADATGKLYIWDRNTPSPKHVCKGHLGTISQLDLTADGARVVSAGEDGTVRVWDTHTGKEIAQFKHDGPVYALAMSPGGKRVVTGGADKTIRLWQLPP